ncbi:rod shape-determining protein MreC [Lentibacillus sp. L22]|uniref:rod shape-determining protein MreC n=1 Tax=Lentibacillus sp. L22 TaxID=3163028 RepID=UPI003466623E
MPFFRKKRLFIILIGFIILVALIGFSLKDRGNLSTPEQFVKDTVGFAQSVIHTPVKFFTNIFTNINDVKDTYKENQLLKEKLSEYKSLVYEVQAMKEENKELRKTLDKTESIRDFNPIQATVMSRTPERWVDQVTINKGKQDGVKKNMAVITADGMIGKIQSVSPFSSTVQLLTGFDQFNRISATISREGKKDIFGLIESYDKESNSLLFKIIEESDKDLEKGEVVVSSGMGGVFPEGLLIGTVKKVVPDQYGLTHTALIKPAANMYKINHVIVVDRDLADKDEVKSGKEDKK